MIESVLQVFEQNITFKIVTKTVTDSFYSHTTPSYATATHKAVVVPHGQSIEQPITNIGIDPHGTVDVYIRGVTLKRDDIVTYLGKDYTVIDVAEWNTTLGTYNCYVCKN